LNFAANAHDENIMQDQNMGVEIQADRVRWSHPKTDTLTGNFQDLGFDYNGHPFPVAQEIQSLVEANFILQVLDNLLVRIHRML
jgi:hypothetical protein